MVSVTEQLWETNPNGTFTYTKDGQGNVTGLWDVASGGYSSKFNYDQYGNVSTTDGNGNPVANTSGLRYRGEYFNATINKTYLRNRDYDSTTGMFMSMDPSGQDTNTYLYCGGDPVNRTDPMGTKWVYVKDPPPPHWEWIPEKGEYSYPSQDEYTLPPFTNSIYQAPWGAWIALRSDELNDPDKNKGTGVAGPAYNAFIDQHNDAVIAANMTKYKVAMLLWRANRESYQRTQVARADKWNHSMGRFGLEFSSQWATHSGFMEQGFSHATAVMGAWQFGWGLGLIEEGASTVGESASAARELPELPPESPPEPAMTDLEEVQYHQQNIEYNLNSNPAYKMRSGEAYPVSETTGKIEVTVAKVREGNWTGYGINGGLPNEARNMLLRDVKDALGGGPGLAPRWLGPAGHAEGDAVWSAIYARERGLITGDSLSLITSRPPCPTCEWGVPRMLDALKFNYTLKY